MVMEEGVIVAVAVVLFKGGDGGGVVELWW